MHDSFWAVLSTSVEYVANDLRKKFKQFMMCVMTVFLTVSFITFLNGVGSLAPIVTLQSSVFTAGDMDMIIMGQSGSTKEVMGNTNFYTDEHEFFNAPFLSNEEKQNLLTVQSFMSKIPTVDFVALNALVEQSYANRTKPIELFPRWTAQTQLNSLDRQFKTQAYLFAGDTRLERNIGVAPGFPKDILKQDEMITT